MHSQILDIILGLCTCFVSIGLVKSERWIIKHVGPRYCEYLCQHTVGSSAIAYNSKNLSCLLLNPNSRITETREMQVINITKEEQLKATEVCAKDSTMFLSKRGKLVCGRVSSKQVTKKGISKQVTKMGSSKQDSPKRRLLIIQSYGMERFQLYLQNDTVALYPYLKKTNEIISVAYISALRTLVVAADQPLLQLASVDSDEHVVIQDPLAQCIRQVTVDEVHQLVIMLSCHPSCCVKTMTTNGAKFRIAFKFPSISGSTRVLVIAIDPKRSTIYALYGGQTIVPFTFMGRRNGRQFDIKNCHGLAFDSKTDCLYFWKEGELYETSVAEYKRRVLVKCDTNPFHFIIFESKVYYCNNFGVFYEDLNLRKTKAIPVGTRVVFSLLL